MFMSAPAELVEGGCHNAEIKVYVNKRRLSLLMAIFFFFSFQPSILFLNLDDFTITPFFVLYVLPFHLPALSFLSLQLSVCGVAFQCLGSYRGPQGHQFKPHIFTGL